jgi:hypothetical protein
MKALRRMAHQLVAPSAAEGGATKPRKRPYGEQVETAFGGVDGSARAKSYVASLQAAMKDIADAQRRSVFLALLIAATMELFNRAAVSNVQVGPFQISDLSLIRKFLPVLFAYLMYDIVVLGLRYLQSWAVWVEILRVFDGALSSSGLQRLLLPVGPSLYGPLFFPERGKLEALAQLFTAVLRLGSLVFPLIIEVYAISILFISFGVNDLLVWLSAIVSAAFLLYGVILFIAGRGNFLGNKWTHTMASSYLRSTAFYYDGRRAGRPVGPALTT